MMASNDRLLKQNYNLKTADYNTICFTTRCYCYYYLLLLKCDDPVSRENFPCEQDHRLLIGDQDRQRWVCFSKDLESLACCGRTLL